MNQKTVLTVQSLACHGKCAITEALPILTACGFAASVLPTVLLSTHTGGFGTPSRLDINGFFEGALKHWCENYIRFDGIGLGYFSNPSQIQTMAENLTYLKKPQGFVLVDPVMGDNGRFFSGIDRDFISGMLSLCKLADVIVPNITEACLLCGSEYKEIFSESEIKELILGLYGIVNTSVVITGVSFDKDTIGAALGEKGEVSFVFSKKQPHNFHGTGDIFAAVVLARLLKGDALTAAVKAAADFVSKSIEKTVSFDFDERNGVNFEELLTLLM